MKENTNLLPIFRKTLTKICNIKFKNISVNICLSIEPINGYLDIEPENDMQIDITIFNKDKAGNRVAGNSVASFRFYEFYPEKEINEFISELITRLKKDDFKQIKNLKHWVQV